jgi:hypothetical protein
MFIAAFLVYNACTLILVVQGITFSGDEPNYLLMSHSLLRDKDIDPANNFANKDYFHFYDKDSNPRLTLGINGRYGRDGKLYSVNLPAGPASLVGGHSSFGRFRPLGSFPSSRLLSRPDLHLSFADNARLLSVPHGQGSRCEKRGRA